MKNIKNSRQISAQYTLGKISSDYCYRKNPQKYRDIICFGTNEFVKIAGALTWYGEVLSVYDLILGVEQLVVILLLGVTVEILQVRHHRHAPPAVARLCAGRDGHRRLRGRVFLTHPAKQEEEMTRETNRDGRHLKQGY